MILPLSTLDFLGLIFTQIQISCQSRIRCDEQDMIRLDNLTTRWCYMLQLRSTSLIITLIKIPIQCQGTKGKACLLQKWTELQSFVKKSPHIPLGLQNPFKSSCEFMVVWNQFEENHPRLLCPELDTSFQIRPDY